jgi:hypothetical protein
MGVYFAGNGRTRQLTTKDSRLRKTTAAFDK